MSDDIMTLATCLSIVADWNRTIAIALVGVAVLLILLLSWFEKRTNIGRDRCGGRPGCLVPVNLIDGDDDRLAYAAAFGCTASTMLALIIETGERAYDGDFALLVEYFLAIFQAVKYGVIYYPLFACLTPTYRFVHSIIGSVYSGIWVAINILNIIYEVRCIRSNDTMTSVLTVLRQLPQLLCLGYLVLVFLHMLIGDIRDTLTSYQELIQRRLANVQQIQHVRKLFQKKVDIEDTTTPMILKVFKNCYKKDRPFKFPLRVIATFSVAFMVLYQIVMVNITVVLVIRARLQDIGGMHLTSVTVCSLVSLALSTSVAVLYIFQMLFAYRTNIRQLYRGDFSNIPEEILKKPAAAVLMDSFYYPGNQIAYLFWGDIMTGATCGAGDAHSSNTPYITFGFDEGHVIQTVVFFLLGLGLAYFVVLPITGQIPLSYLEPVATVVCVAIFSTLFRSLQRFVSRRWLLQDHAINRDEDRLEKVLSIQNRKTYHNMAYFLFFYSLVIGVFDGLERIMYASAIGLMYIGRLDKSVLLTGFEKWDTGYMAYVGFLQMELTHCHPVVVVFCDQLLEQQKANAEAAAMANPLYDVLSPGSTRSSGRLNDTGAYSSGSYDTSVDTKQVLVTPRYDKRIRNRWLKAYTLLNNKSLQKTARSTDHLLPSLEVIT